MSAHDCFEIGRTSYIDEEFYISLMWMNESLSRLNDNTDKFMNVTKTDILEYIASSYYKQGEFEKIDINFQMLILILQY